LQSDEEISNNTTPEPSSETPGKYDLGLQPIDMLMTSLGIKDADLVKASTQQLTFKMVQKARKGRRLTRRVQWKIFNAFRTLKPDQKYALKDFFNY
jgi:hypothetical protein